MSRAKRQEGGTTGPVIPPSLEAIHPEHAVRFYRDDALLVHSLSNKVRQILLAGNSTVVIATEAHRNDMARRLSESGVPLAHGTAQGRYLALDAVEMLETFMKDGWPDEDRFKRVIGDVIKRAAVATGSEHNCVFVFGEMVAVLWSQGKTEATLRLEEQWNNMVQTHSLALHCAYSLHDPDAGEEALWTSATLHGAASFDQQHASSTEEATPGSTRMQNDMPTRAANCALDESERRFRQLVANAQDYAIFMLDTQGRILTWNDGARRIKGYEAAEIIGRHFSCFYLEEDIRTGKPDTDLAIATAKGQLVDEGWRLRKDGSRFWANVTIAVLKDESGTPYGFSKITRDITENMQAQALLKDTNERLRRGIEERILTEQQLLESEASLRILSHRLLRLQDDERRRVSKELHETIGQYLVALKMGLETLYFAPGLDAKGLRERLQENIELAERCINEIRAMSYVLHPPVLEEMGLIIVIPWYIDRFAKRTGIKTTLEMPSELSRLPTEIELTLFHVLQECLANVHRHSGSSTARIHVVVTRETVSLQVEDDGKGMPTSVMDWTPIGRHDASIGLRSIKERLRLLGGKLQLSSATNGATVIASIPCNQPQISEVA